MKFKTTSEKRKERTRFKLRACSTGRHRLSVFRSNNHIYCQIIDDANRSTLCSASSNEKEEKIAGSNKSGAESIGKKIAQRAIQNGIKAVYFDRGSYLYHGRVKALAEAARAEGLEF
jgi:large subunit ribosomal protein L18